MLQYLFKVFLDTRKRNQIRKSQKEKRKERREKREEKRETRTRPNHRAMIPPIFNIVMEGGYNTVFPQGDMQDAVLIKEGRGGIHALFIPHYVYSFPSGVWVECVSFMD
jgi:hypothetical protein